VVKTLSNKQGKREMHFASEEGGKTKMHTLSLQLHHCSQQIELYFTVTGSSVRLELRFASSMLEMQKFALQRITYSHHAYDVMRCQNASAGLEIALRTFFPTKL
jgi:hypothetical protein